MNVSTHSNSGLVASKNAGAGDSASFLSAPVKSPKPTTYSYIVNILLLGIFISNQWGRYTIAYVYSFKDDRPKYSIKEAYSQLDDNSYGLLAGTAFAVPIAFVGLYGGMVSDKFNRTVVLCISCILWSATLVVSGTIESFWVFCFMRFLLGIFEAFCNPCAYSIISDYFHPDFRGTANSIFTIGIYIGGALSSVSVVIIKQLGWKLNY
jgi:MFS family permease